MRTVLHTVLAAKFDDNFIREEMIDETAKKNETSKKGES